jgi:hypothetical protein
MNLAVLAERAREAALAFLLIGGHAVVAHGHPRRVEKDVDDVIGLVRANHLDVAEPQWRELFLKYGPPELHEKLLRLQRPTAT